jgi:gamma-glutamyl:cysteine ligase YbdK (ATP-grasp superfamily)
MLTTLEDRRVGLEQEFLLVDEDGVLSNRADEFLTRCREAAVAAGRDPGSYAPECARSMVEINTPPVYTLDEQSGRWQPRRGQIPSWDTTGWTCYSGATTPKGA